MIRGFGSVGARGLRCAAMVGAIAAVGASASVAAGAVAVASSGTVSTSHTFAGFKVAEPTRHITSASVTFVVPAITCHANFSGVGPSVLITSTVRHHRYSFSGGAVAVACQDNLPVYVALPVVDSNQYDDYGVPVAAGDRVTVAVRYGQTTKVTWTNDTTHQVDVHTGKRSRGEDAYFGDNGIAINHRNVGLDAFTKTSFSAAKVNGRAIGREAPVRYTWVNKSHVVLVTASKLSHRGDFTTTFRHAG